MTLSRINHTGAAPSTTLNGSITAGATTLTLASGTGYPTANFVIKIDAGTSSEEKILVGARSGTACSSLTRGYDSTVAASHSSGAAVEHDLAAVVIDDANDHVYTTSRDDHTQYLRVDGTRAGTGAQTIGGALTVSSGGAAITGNSTVTGTLTSSSTITASAGGVTVTAGGLTVSAGGAAVTGNSTVTGNLTVTGTFSGPNSGGAWTTYTPTWATSGTAPTLGNGTLTGSYIEMGKLLVVRLSLSFGSTTNPGTGTWTFSLPGGMNGANSGSVYQLLQCFANASGTLLGGLALVEQNATVIRPFLSTSSSNTLLAQIANNVPVTWTTGQIVSIEGVIELQ